VRSAFSPPPSACLRLRRVPVAQEAITPVSCRAARYAAAPFARGSRLIESSVLLRRQRVYSPAPCRPPPDTRRQPSARLPSRPFSFFRSPARLQIPQPRFQRRDRQVKVWLSARAPPVTLSWSGGVAGRMSSLSPLPSSAPGAWIATPRPSFLPPHAYATLPAYTLPCPRRVVPSTPRMARDHAQRRVTHHVSRPAVLTVIPDRRQCRHGTRRILQRHALYSSVETRQVSCSIVDNRAAEGRGGFRTLQRFAELRHRKPAVSGQCAVYSCPLTSQKSADEVSAHSP